MAAHVILVGGFHLGEDGGDVRVGLDHGIVDLLVKDFHLSHEIGIGHIAGVTGIFHFLPEVLLLGSEVRIGLNRLVVGRLQFLFFFGRKHPEMVMMGRSARGRRGGRRIGRTGLRQGRVGQESGEGQEKKRAFHHSLMTQNPVKSFIYFNDDSHVVSRQISSAGHKHPA